MTLYSNSREFHEIKFNECFLPVGVVVGVVALNVLLGYDMIVAKQSQTKEYNILFNIILFG